MVRVVVIGLDAAEPSLIAGWKDELPNLSRIMREGAYGRMRSSDPPESVPAWNCLCTGKNPGKIGVFDFFYREKGSYRIKVVNSTAIQTPTIWKILGATGKKVAVICMPSTFPPDMVNGIMVSGVPLPVANGQPLKNYTYPAGLSEEIDRLVGGFEYALSFNVPEDFSVSKVSWATSTLAHDKENEGLSRAEEKLIRVTKHLLQNTPWDLFMVVFRELDRVGHFMWKHMEEDRSDSKNGSTFHLRDTIKRTYIRMDEAVGELLSLVGSETVVFVVSDHGFGPLHKRFFVNEFLQRIGMLKLKGTKRLQVSFTRKLRLGAPEVMQLLLRLKIHWLVGLVPRSLRRMVRSIDEFEVNVERIDWGRTKAYSFGEVGRIFLNVKGREPQGTVEPGQEYEHVRDFIIQKLQELTDPATGAKVVDRVFKREEIYCGGFLDEAPDILFYMDGLKCITSTRLGHHSLFDGEKLISGTHRHFGIFMAYGDMIRKGASVEVGICDVAPTILHIMGLPIPEDMDGRPVLDILEPHSEAARRSVAYQKPIAAPAKTFEWTREEEKKLEEQLRDLGYLG